MTEMKIYNIFGLINFYMVIPIAYLSFSLLYGKWKRVGYPYYFSKKNISIVFYYYFSLLLYYYL